MRICGGGTNEGRSRPGQLGQPHGIAFVGLRPAGGVLDLPGIDQLHVQTTRLQQVEPDPPVVRCGLDRDPLDLLTHEMIAKVEDRPGDGGYLPDLADPPAGAAVGRQANANRARLLGHVDRTRTRDDQFVIFIRNHLGLCHHLDQPPHQRVPVTQGGMPGGLGREPKF
jgi:hypothetical protein